MKPPKPLCTHCGKPKSKGRGRRLCDECRAAWRHKLDTNPCLRCGEPSAPHQQLCPDCKELAAWKDRKRRRHPPRRPCALCKKVKPAGRGRQFCDACREKRAPIAPCSVCHERPRRYRTAQLCQFCFDTREARIRAYRRAYHQTHPDTRDRSRPVHRETRRINRRLVAERNGQPMPEVAPEIYTERYGIGLDKMIDAEPLLAFVAGRDDLNRALASADYDAIRNARKRGHLALAIADRVITALDGRLAYVYPDL